MSGLTDHFGLLRMRPGESFAQNDGQFLDADRVTIDRELYFARVHRHDGEAAVDASPEDPPDLELDTDAGQIPAGTRVYYRYSLVDENDAETAASPQAFVDTPAAIAIPGAVVPATFTTGGTLLAGTYFYVLSAYTDDPSEETRAQNFANIPVPITTSTNRIVLTLPSLPAGATGFNVYRRRPGAHQYFYLDSIDMSVATPPTTYEDDGSVAEDCDRTLPITNSTNSTNSVVVTLPGVTPAVPAGYTWKLYRTYVAGSWAVSLVHHIVEETFEGSGIITPTYTDTGLATSAGQPLEATTAAASPSKIDLEDGSEVSGRLPMSQVSAFPWAEVFGYRGVVVQHIGTAAWVCPFPQARIQSCRAHLGRGYAPASQQVIVDVNKGTDSATPTYTTIYTTQANRPRIQVGQQIGVPTVPNIIELVEGESLTVDIDQAGGGASPTDYELVVTIYMYVYGYTDPESMDW